MFWSLVLSWAFEQTLPSPFTDHLALGLLISTGTTPPREALAAYSEQGLPCASIAPKASNCPLDLTLGGKLSYYWPESLLHAAEPSSNGSRWMLFLSVTSWVALGESLNW